MENGETATQWFEGDMIVKIPAPRPMTIYLITTGGTIAQGYSEQPDKVLNLHCKIAQYLERLRLARPAYY